MKRHITTAIFIGLAIQLNSQSLYFPPNTGDEWETIPASQFNWCDSRIDSLYAFLDKNNTKAFLLLKDGKIVLEKYFGTHTQTSIWYWASAGKSLTAFMVGIAQQEKLLSITDSTSKYLGRGWTSCDLDKEEKITIRHQLTMTTGLDDGVADPFCTSPGCLLFKADAGTRWAYHNGPYTLLDQVMETATGTNLNVYTTQKLKNPTGMTGLFVKVDENNIFYSTARSMARFGLLVLNKGTWNGNQILTDIDYFQAMTHSSQSINPAYGYLWWLNGSDYFMIPQTQFVFNGMLSPNAPADMIAAMGKNGQFINVVPSDNLVWIRMGEAPDNSLVPFLLNDQIWKYLSELECVPDEANSPHASPISIIDRQGHLVVASDATFCIVEVYDNKGHLICLKEVNSKQVEIPFNTYKTGLYMVKVNYPNGCSQVQKIIIN